MNKTATLLLLCTALFAQQKGTFTDTRDGKTYKTVKIGEQVWMAENLNFAAKGSRCYNDSIAYCGKYGRLYDWVTAMVLPKSCINDMCALVDTKYKGICPTGWHLPNEAEWGVLTEAANVTDACGFSFLPSDCGRYGSRLSDVGYLGSWWSSSTCMNDNICEISNSYAVSIRVSYNDKTVYFRNSFKINLYSVCCVQD